MSAIKKTDFEAWCACWFERGGGDNIRFWSRFSSKPDLLDKTVLEVGCGHGRLCLDMAKDGAKRVLGIDAEKSLIDFARRNLCANHPEWQAIVSYEHRGVDSLTENAFDLVVSKDVFEHVLNLPGLLVDIRRCLKPGGRLYTGFGPLFNSPSGHHDRMHFGLPWGHLLIPRAWHLALVNCGRNAKLRSLYEADTLNELKFADYERIFASSGFKMVEIRVNQSEHVGSKILSWLRRIPFFREYCTHNVYCIMEKARSAAGSEVGMRGCD